MGGLLLVCPIPALFSFPRSIFFSSVLGLRSELGLTNEKGFADDHALILYVYLANYDDGEDGSVLTVGSPPFVSCFGRLT